MARKLALLGIIGSAHVGIIMALHSVPMWPSGQIITYNFGRGYDVPIERPVAHYEPIVCGGDWEPFDEPHPEDFVDNPTEPEDRSKPNRTIPAEPFGNYDLRLISTPLRASKGCRRTPIKILLVRVAHRKLTEQWIHWLPHIVRCVVLSPRM